MLFVVEVQNEIVFHSIIKYLSFSSKNIFVQKFFLLFNQVIDQLFVPINVNGTSAKAKP